MQMMHQEMSKLGQFVILTVKLPRSTIAGKIQRSVLCKLCKLFAGFTRLFLTGQPHHLTAFFATLDFHV
ncbi:hypothetical protein I79_011128 [Cricetulus griseus]|uniref:Uncharacterized protein n=1 Tax=Cricetulus griseus TaxID=10029 RepID=G3HKA9_CRIGR|nr:hypothetical protein I79_011128 [Cricetulus griseus]